MPHDVFISYSSKDKNGADAAVEALEKAGINCWIAPRNVRPGMQYGGQILTAISSCRLLVLILTPEANASAHVVNEVERAVSKNIPIFPVLVKRVTPTGSMELFISSTQWLDAASGLLEKHLPDLVKAVKGKLEKQKAEAREISAPQNRTGSKKSREAWERHEAWLLQEKQRAEEARKNLASRRQLREKTEYLLGRGRRALEGGLLAEAMEILGEVLKLSPENSEARILLRKTVTRKIKMESQVTAADQAEKKGKLPEAIQALTALKPLAADPEAIDRNIERLLKETKRRIGLEILSRKEKKSLETRVKQITLRLEELIPALENLEDRSQAVKDVFRDWREAVQMAGLWQQFFERFPEAAGELNARPDYWPAYWQNEAQRENCFKNRFDMEFAPIPAGYFYMGSPEEETGRHADEKRHLVTISTPFLMQTTPVTRAHWAVVTGSESGHFSGDPRAPVVNVSYKDCLAFVAKLNVSEKTKSYRLPSEAEWEYACRAGTENVYFGFDRPGELKEFAWFIENTDAPQPAGLKKPNPWGLYDMLGNVWEWCLDWYGAYPPGPLADPQGPALGLDRVHRGGSFKDAAQYCRPAARLHLPPGQAADDLGFRVVKTEGNPF